MTLGEFKKSIKKLGSDFDDIEILIQAADEEGKTIIDLLSYVGHTADFSAIIFGGYYSALNLYKEGKLPLDKAKLVEDHDKSKNERKRKKDNNE